MNEIENKFKFDKEFSTISDNEIQVDYSMYTWYKGETENPYTFDTFHPLAAPFWEEERKFHLQYINDQLSSTKMKEAYEAWKKDFLTKGLYKPTNNSGTRISNNTAGSTNWTQSFETGKVVIPSKNS